MGINSTYTSSKTSVSSMNAEVLSEAINRMNVILLIPHGRAGSVFTQSLFDGHDQVVQFPSWWNKYEFKFGTNDFSEILNKFCNKKKDLFDSRYSYLDKFGESMTTLGENRSEDIKIDVKRFKATAMRLVWALKDFIGRDVKMSFRKLFFIIIHIALARLQGRDIRKLKYIFYHLHNYHDEDMPKLLQDFPNLYFIATARDLRESWTSWRRAMWHYYGVCDRDEQVNRFLRSLRSWLRYHDNFLVYYPRLRSGHVKIVDLHRLHILQDKTMKELAWWLGIEYMSCLLESTFWGKTWWGNAANQQPVKGFSRERSVMKWKHELSPQEIEIINYFTFNIRKAFHQEIPDDGLPEVKDLYLNTAGVKLTLEELREMDLINKKYKNVEFRDCDFIGAEQQ